MGRLGCCAAKLALVSLLVMNVRCNETTHNDDAGVVSLGPADLPSQVQEAFKVAGIFDKMVSQSNTPTREQQQLPEEDLVSLTMSPLKLPRKKLLVTWMQSPSWVHPHQMRTRSKPRSVWC